ncbi:MAG: ISNCY family transposase [Chitinophagales bacterium]
MRQRFEQQISIGGIAIKDVQFPLKSRDEVPPVLKALQYIFITPELNEQVFAMLENSICKDKKKTGRKGMDLWHILVLSVVRHATGTNWDTLTFWSNDLMLLRKIMGVHSKFDDVDSGITFNYQSIIDNVSLIDEELLYNINNLVVDAGHQLVKKKEEESLELKTDSYAVETNVHFPTDLNLLWDSVRKSFDMVEKLQRISGKIEGWRKIKYLRSHLKSLFRTASQHVFKGKNEKQKMESVKLYLKTALELKERCTCIIKSSPAVIGSQLSIPAIIEVLDHYCSYIAKFADQVERRIIKGEVIPAEEKVFSIFEPHTEWITKGKQNKKVELGHLLLVTTDQYQFIVDYKVMEKQKDPSQVKPLLERLQKKYPSRKISSHSFDKGFYSKDNQEVVEQSTIDLAVLPKRGRHNKEDKARESNPEFKRLKRKHSAVESNINMLEHHGLNRCMDKGLRNFKCYVGLSVLAYNLHIMGNIVLEAERKKEEQKQKRQMKMAA